MSDGARKDGEARGAQWDWSALTMDGLRAVIERSERAKREAAERIGYTGRGSE